VRDSIENAAPRAMSPAILAAPSTCAAASEAAGGDSVSLIEAAPAMIADR
jgi:hypothetical protein